jgi:hypothetical protein
MFEALQGRLDQVLSTYLHTSKASVYIWYEWPYQFEAFRKAIMPAPSALPPRTVCLLATLFRLPCLCLCLSYR